MVPVFVRNGPNAGKGNTALLQHGARTWPNPQDRMQLGEALSEAAAAAAAEPRQETLSFAFREQPPSYGVKNAPDAPAALQPETTAPETQLTPKQLIFGSVREILSQQLLEPKTEKEVAELLEVSKSQAKAWLTRLVAEGEVERITKPLRYRATRPAARLL